MRLRTVSTWNGQSDLPRFTGDFLSFTFVNYGAVENTVVENLGSCEDHPGKQARCDKKLRETHDDQKNLYFEGDFVEVSWSVDDVDIS